VIHERNQYVNFVTDEDYRFVIERSDKSLATSRFAHLYEIGEEKVA